MGCRIIELRVVGFSLPLGLLAKSQGHLSDALLLAVTNSSLDVAQWHGIHDHQTNPRLRIVLRWVSSRGGYNSTPDA